MQRYPLIGLAATGRNMEKLRREAGLSVRALQEAFGFSSPQAIYKWQRGQALPTLDKMTVLSRLLRRSIEHILVLEQEREP